MNEVTSNVDDTGTRINVLKKKISSIEAKIKELEDERWKLIDEKDDLEWWEKHRGHNSI